MTTPVSIRSRRLVLAVVTLLLLAACGSDAADETATEPVAEATTAPTATEEPTAAGTATEPGSATETGAGDSAADAAEDATVAIAPSDLGEIVVDGQGRTLYLLTADTPGESTCFDDCAGAWPPFTVDTAPTAGEGVDQALLGTIERDGAMQVTYGDWPLYHFQGDAGPGEVNGQGIESFGGVWWVVGPDGEAIEEAAVSAAAGGY